MVVLRINIGCKFLMMVRYNSIALVCKGVYPFPIRAQFYFLFQYDVHYSPPIMLRPTFISVCLLTTFFPKFCMFHIQYVYKILYNLL
jgi:hypothetical protein